MKRKIMVIALVLTFVLSSFSVALADNRVDKDADRKPLDAVITLCKIGYEGAYGGGITWTFKELYRYWAGGSSLTVEYDWVPSNANIFDDPLDWDIVYDRYAGLVNAITYHGVQIQSALDPNAWLNWVNPPAGFPGTDWDLSYSFEGVAIGAPAVDTGATVWDLNRFLNVPQIKTPITASAARAKKAAEELLVLWARWVNLRAGSQRDAKWANPGQMAIDLANEELWLPIAGFVGAVDDAATYDSALTKYEKEAIAVLAADIIADPWLLMDENVDFSKDIKPSVTVKQVGNVILTITEQSASHLTFNDVVLNNQGAVARSLEAWETYPSQGFRKRIAYNEGYYYNNADRIDHKGGIPHHFAHGGGAPLMTYRGIPWFLSAGGPADSTAKNRHFSQSIAAAFDLRYNITDPGNPDGTPVTPGTRWWAPATPFVSMNPINPGDSFTFYYNPTIIYDIQYQNDLIYGDYVTAFDGTDGVRPEWGAHFFENITPGKAGNLNFNFDMNRIPYYTQAAWGHSSAKLSEMWFYLLDIMENNFQDMNTIVLNSFHGEFASQYQWVFVNAPFNTPIYENTLTLKATTSTAGVTLAIDGSTVIATYANISAGTIDWTLEAFDRNMHIVFLASNIDKYPWSNLKHTVVNKFGDRDLRLYADWTRWDDESLEMLRRPIKEYNTTALNVSTPRETGYRQFHITGLVSYAGQNYVVTQPVTFAQNPTHAIAVKVGAPKDLRVGGTAAMDIVYEPAGAVWDGKLKFESLTPEICTVDENGIVTGLVATPAAGTFKGYILVTGVDMKGAVLQYADGTAADLDGKLKIEIKVSSEAPIYWKNALIVGEWADIYKTADATAESWGKVAPGTIITYSSETKIVNGFLEVLHNNAKAYINMKSISFETDPTPPSGVTPPTADINTDGVAAVVTTKGGKLNVRNAPNGKIIGQLTNGTAVAVYEISGSWSRIGEGQWVASNYLR